MNSTDATEQLLRCCPDDREPDSPGVYALEIDVPHAVADDLEAQWLDHFEELPDEYWHRIVDCDRVIYIGETGDVQARLDDHITSGKRKATLPYVFGVSRLLDVWWHDSKQDAKEAEYNRAREIDKQTLANTYVHSR